MTKQTTGDLISKDLAIRKLKKKLELDPIVGTLSTRKNLYSGVVEGIPVNGMAKILIEDVIYIKKYQRYAKRTRKRFLHIPHSLQAKIKKGQKIFYRACRKISKLKSHVITEYEE